MSLVFHIIFTAVDLGLPLLMVIAGALADRSFSKAPPSEFCDKPPPTRVACRLNRARPKVGERFRSNRFLRQREIARMRERKTPRSRYFKIPRLRYSDCVALATTFAHE